MMTKAQKISLAIILVILLLLIVAIAAFIGSGNVRPAGNKAEEQTGNLESDQKETENEKATMQKETQKLIDEARRIAAEAEAKKQNGENINTAKFGQVVSVPGSEGETASGTEEKKAIIVVPGSSMVSIETGEVLTDEGSPADNSLDPADPNSPRQSFSIEDASVLPASTIKLTISEGKIEPANFKVKAGQAVLIAVTSKSQYGDIFRFESSELAGVSVGVGGNETRSITFNAPKEAGEYLYFSDVRKQKESGATGTMIVE